MCVIQEAPEEETTVNEEVKKYISSIQSGNGVEMSKDKFTHQEVIQMLANNGGKEAEEAVEEFLFAYNASLLASSHGFNLLDQFASSVTNAKLQTKEVQVKSS